MDGGAAGSTGGVLPPFGSLLSKGTGTETGAPKAYLNFLVFDRDYNLLNGGFISVTTAAREYGQDGSHEELFKELAIAKAGYVYLYLSNDNAALGGAAVEVFFDDFTVEHVKSPVVQQDDYYAFGLEFNSYQRENAIKNNYLYNGKEKQDELGLGWLDYGARMYMADIGRWGVVDPKVSQYSRWSPYNFVMNSPLILYDPNGMEVKWIRGEGVSRKEFRRAKREYKMLGKESATAKIIQNDLEKKVSKGGKLHTITVTEKSQNSNRSNSGTQPISGFRNLSSGGDGTNITYDIGDRKEDLEGTSESTQRKLVLGHELGHAWLIDQGVAKSSPSSEAVNNLKPDDKLFSIKLNAIQNAQDQWLKNEEVNGATHIENMMRGEMNVPLREYYQPKGYEGERWKTIKPGHDYKNNNLYKEYGIVD